MVTLYIHNLLIKGLAQDFVDVIQAEDKMETAYLDPPLDGKKSSSCFHNVVKQVDIRAN